VCFALSGFAGIVYQIAWARQFALGVRHDRGRRYARPRLLLAGLGLGALAGAEISAFIAAPVRVLPPGLELIIGASAIAWVPAVIAGSDLAAAQLGGGRPELPGDRAARWDIP